MDTNEQKLASRGYFDFWCAPEHREKIAGKILRVLNNKPPFDECASIVIHGNDFAHAEWIGDELLPVPFSYHMLPCIEQLPWKLLEVADEPNIARKWFKRA